MSTNLSEGGLQIFSLSIDEINLAFLDVLNRLDRLAGLRGKTQLYDRLGISDPTEDGDAVPLGILQEGTAFAAVPLYLSPSTPLGIFAPGTAYIEPSIMLRQRCNFASPQSLEGRVIVEGWGTGSGSTKGVAVTTASGAVLAQVTWNGTTAGMKVGTFATITESLDQAIALRVKGSSATEALILSSVIFDLRYAVVTTA